MSDAKHTPERFSLKRWSARKLDAARAAESAPVASELPPTPPAVAPINVTSPHAAQADAAAELPPVESLTFESDFTAFLRPKVAEPLKRQALKKLFTDPRFNVMDGLDVYIDDYSVPSPLEPELVKELMHARFTLDPPRTRVNAQGHVEDVPPEEIAAEQPEAPDAISQPSAPQIAHAAPEVVDVSAQVSSPEPSSIVPETYSK